MPSTPTVLVLGAAGRFGQAATAAFARAGWQVVAQRRPGPRPGAALPAGVRLVQADAQDTAALAAQVGRADVVVHAMNPPYTLAAWRAGLPRLLRAAVAASRAFDALLMLPGNVYNFGAGMPAVLHEDTPQRPTTHKGALRVALEREMAAAPGVRSVVIRAGDFFGCGRGSLLDQVFAKRLAQGRIGLPGDLATPTPFAYLPDLAQAFVRVAERRERLDRAEVLHFAGHVLRGQDWTDLLVPIAREAGWLGDGRAPRIDRMPWALVRAGGLLVPEWASIAEMRYLWRTPHRLANTRLQALIGPEPHTAIETAVRRALADLGLVEAARPAFAV